MLVLFLAESHVLKDFCISVASLVNPCFFFFFNHYQILAGTAATAGRLSLLESSEVKKSGV